LPKVGQKATKTIAARKKQTRIRLCAKADATSGIESGASYFWMVACVAYSAEMSSVSLLLHFTTTW
jgi:hypothetical protein